MLEDFELLATGGFYQLDSSWSWSGNNNWFVQSSGCMPGSTRCIQSKTITHNENAAVLRTFEFDFAGAFVFDLFCDSEQSYDFCEFFVGGSRVASYSGQVGWVTVTRNVNAGSHQMMWKYRKDGSVNRGLDAMRVDNIRFVMS